MKVKDLIVDLLRCDQEHTVIAGHKVPVGGLFWEAEFVEQDNGNKLVSIRTVEPRKLSKAEQTLKSYVARLDRGGQKELARDVERRGMSLIEMSEEEKNGKPAEEEWRSKDLTEAIKGTSLRVRRLVAKQNMHGNVMRTLGDLADLGPDRVVKFKNCGWGTAREIQRIFVKHGATDGVWRKSKDADTEPIHH